MKKTTKIVCIIVIYAVIAVLIALSLVYFYQTNDFFRSLFDGGVTSPTKLATGNDVREAAKTVETINKTAGLLSLFILISILVLQAFAFVTAASVFVGLRHSTETIPVRMRKLDNADLFLDLPLYFGLLGTVASFIVMSFNPNISRLIAYSSTLVGIIFSVILRLSLQYPLRQALICAAASNHEELDLDTEMRAATLTTSTARTTNAAPAASAARPASVYTSTTTAPATPQKTQAASAPKTVNLQTPPASAPKTVNLQKTPSASAPKTVNLQKTQSAQGSSGADKANQAQNEGKEN